MKPPRLFLGLILIFWGMQTNAILLGAILAVSIELARSIKHGFDLKPSDFNTFVDISTVLLVGTLVTAFVLDAQKAIFTLLRWLPVIYFPVLIAQELSTAGAIDIRAFLLTARKKIKRQPLQKRTVDVGYIYAILALISAGSTPGAGTLYFQATSLFLAWSLFQARSPRYRVITWCCCLLLVLAGGYIGKHGIELTGQKIRQMMFAYYGRHYDTNPFRSATALGDMGKLKLSASIAARVYIDNNIPGKRYLLQDATYSIFLSPRWFAKSPFSDVPRGNIENSWILNPTNAATETMTVYLRPKKNRAVLMLPQGTVNINEMKAERCEKNGMRTVRIEDVPGLVKIRAAYTDNLLFDPEPTAADLAIPKQEAKHIQSIARRLGLYDLEPTGTVVELRAFFARNFSYSLDLSGKGEADTPLQNFLQNTRSGHCELFATATALLLREAGIPARYATGYIAHEYEPITGQYIVRHRDAHSWVKLYINGQWQILDTTPESFLETDAARVDTSTLKDLFSYLGFQAARLRHETGGKLLRDYGIWLLLPTICYLGFRLRKTRHVRWVRTAAEKLLPSQEVPDEYGFRSLELLLAQQGQARKNGESYRQWLRRVAESHGSNELSSCLQILVHAHAKDRYSRSGLTRREQTSLAQTMQTARRLLETYRQ